MNKLIYLFLNIILILCSCSTSYQHPFLHNQNQFFDVGGYFYEEITISYFKQDPPSEVVSFTYFQDDVSKSVSDYSSRDLVTENSLINGNFSIFLYGDEEATLSTVRKVFKFPEIKSSNFLPAVYEKLLGTPKGTRLVLILPPKDAYKYLGIGEIIPHEATIIMVFDISS